MFFNEYIIVTTTRRVKAREVCGEHASPTPPRTSWNSFHSVGAEDLCQLDLCIAGGQDLIEHDPTTLHVRALSILYACTVLGLLSASTAWGTD